MIWQKIRRLLALIRVALSRYWVPKNQLRFKQAAVNEVSLLVLVNEDVGRELVYGGSFEARETAVLRRQLKADDICIDVGANIGYYTTLMAKYARHGQVHAFEPVPMNWHILNCNLQANALINVVPNLFALGADSGEVTFSVSRDGAYSSLRPTGREIELEVIKSKVMPLDDYIFDHQLSKVDFIKADVEGAEEMVLLGSEKLLCDPVKRPRLIMLELYDLNLRVFNTNIDQVLSRMSTRGYCPKIANYEGMLIPFHHSMKNRICNIFFELC